VLPYRQNARQNNSLTKGGRRLMAKDYWATSRTVDELASSRSLPGDLNVSDQLCRVTAITVRSTLVLKFPLQGWLYESGE